MADDNSAKFSMLTAIIGAVGAIVAAVIPICLNQRAADPPSAPAKVDAGSGVPKPTPHPSKKAVDAAGSRSGAPGGGDKSKGPTTRSPKTEHKVVPADLARLQGEWSVPEQTVNSKVHTKEDQNRMKLVWQVDGDRLAVVNHGDQRGLIYWRGTIRLHPDLSPKTFDLNGKNRTDQDIEWLGIYAFEGPEVVLRFRVHQVGKGPKPTRPDSLEIEPGLNAGYFVRLRRAKQ